MDKLTLFVVCLFFSFYFYIKVLGNKVLWLSLNLGHVPAPGPHQDTEMTDLVEEAPLTSMVKLGQVPLRRHTGRQEGIPRRQSKYYKRGRDSGLPQMSE